MLAREWWKGHCTCKFGTYQWNRAPALIVVLQNKQEGRSIEIYPWLQKATLDVIGSAGFGVEFKSLTPDQTSRTKEVAIYEDMMTEFINPVHFIERIDKALGTYNVRCILNAAYEIG